MLKGIYSIVTGLSFVYGKICNGSRPLTLLCTVLYKIYVKVIVTTSLVRPGLSPAWESFNENNNNVGGKGFESLTPLHKRTETLWQGKQYFKNRAISREHGPTVYKYSLPSCLLHIYILSTVKCALSMQIT
jgi:hypothetical protein